MAALNFTVDHDHGTADVDGEGQLVGWITCTTTSIPGDFRARELGTNPKTVRLLPFKGYLAADGHMYKDQTRTEPFRLVANDPDFNLHHLTYQVDFDLTTVTGVQVPVPRTYFPAPSTDTVVYLTHFMRQSNQAVMEARSQGYAEDIIDSGVIGRAILRAVTLAAFTAAGGVHDWDPRLDDARVPIPGSVGLDALDAVVASMISPGSFSVFNTVDHVTNFEQAVFRYIGNALEIGHIFGGTGLARIMYVGVGASADSGGVQRYTKYQATPPFMSEVWNATSVAGDATNIGAGSSFTGASGMQTARSITPTINQSGTAGYTGRKVDVTETATGSGSKWLDWLGVGGVAKYTVDNAGNVGASGTITSNGSAVLVSGGALGTPASGTLTNCSFPTLNQNTTGSAAKLTTARTIDGQSFDGSANVTVIAPGTHAATAKITLADADEFPFANSESSWALGKSTFATLRKWIRRWLDAATTTTAAGTTTLASTDPWLQIFTGGSTQTVQLPTTGVLQGEPRWVLNASSGSVTVQSSGGNNMGTVTTGRFAEFRALQDNPTTAAHWTPLAPTTNGGIANSIAMRDANTNIYAGGFFIAVNTIATSGGTTTLTQADGASQRFTGTQNHTAKWPSSGISANNLLYGANESSGTITIQSSGGNTITTLAPGEAKIFIATMNSPTTAAGWRAI